MRFLKAAYVLILGIAVMLGSSLGHAQDQGGSSGGQTGQVVGTEDYLTDAERGNAPKTQLNLNDTMNFEECVDFKKTVGGTCKEACKGGLDIGIGLLQFDYYEPLALVESVPRSWATLFKDTENFISRAFTKFKDTPFGGEEGCKTIKTQMGNYPQRCFETHVWGLSIPTRFLMAFQEAAENPVPTERMIGMMNSLTYEIGLIIAEMTGAGEINSLDDLIRNFVNVVANFFTFGGYTYLRTMQAIQAIYDTVTSLMDIFKMFMKALEFLTSLVNDPLQAAVKALIKLILGEKCAEQGASNSSYYNTADWEVVDWAANPNGRETTTISPDDAGISNPDNTNTTATQECEPDEDSLYAKMTKTIKKLIKSLKEKFGEIITALQLERAFKVFANFAKSISNGFDEFTEGWSGEAGSAAKEVGEASTTCSNRAWLCNAQNDLGSAGTPGGTLEGSGTPQTNVSGASSAVNNRITELGGSCSNGQPVGNWGDLVSTCDSNGALDRLGGAMETLNRMQDVFRSGSVINLMGAAAGSLLPIGLIPSYISEFDRPAWNKGTPNFISVFQSMVAHTPFLCGGAEVAATFEMSPLSDSAKNSFCIGVWGPLYPKVGSVTMDDPHKAAAITNFRGFSLAANWGTFPVPFDPKKSSVRMNVDHPFKGDRCYDLGTLNPNWESKLANEGGSTALDSMTGGTTTFVREIGGALQAAAENQPNSVQDGSKTDGWVHTYWKKTRTCVSVCAKSGAKWKKVY